MAAWAEDAPAPATEQQQAVPAAGSAAPVSAADCIDEHGEFATPSASATPSSSR